MTGRELLLIERKARCVLQAVMILLLDGSLEQDAHLRNRYFDLLWHLFTLTAVTNTIFSFTQAQPVLVYHLI